MGFCESEVTYRLDYSSYSKDEAAYGFTIFGSGVCGGCQVEDLCFNCNKRLFECSDIDYPILYNGVQIKHEHHESSAGQDESYYVFINGYEYSVTATYDPGRKLTQEEVSQRRETINEALYSVICGIVDEAQAEKL